MARIGQWVMALMAGWFMPGTVWAEERVYEWGWAGHPMGWMWGAWGTGLMFLHVLVWGLVIVGILLGIRWLVSQGRESRPDSALEILRQRYARGELSKEEFEARKPDLS